MPAALFVIAGGCRALWPVPYVLIIRCFSIRFRDQLPAKLQLFRRPARGWTVFSLFTEMLAGMSYRPRDEGVYLCLRLAFYVPSP